MTSIAALSVVMTIELRTYSSIKDLSKIEVHAIDATIATIQNILKIENLIKVLI